jgi:hypothetical protein
MLSAHDARTVLPEAAVALKHLVAVLTFLALTLSAAGVAQAAEAEKEGTSPAKIGDSITWPLAPVAQYEPQAKRPLAMPALYAMLGAVQAWDVYSTRTALKAGAREANPAAAAFAGNSASLIGLKVAATASTIFFAERMWKKNKVGAIVMLAAINGATAVVSMHNMRTAKLAAAQR